MVGYQTREFECCKRYKDRSWPDILEELRRWKCSQLDNYCKYGRFASFSTFFDALLYNYYCNYTVVVETCLTQVVATVSAVQQRSKHLWPSIDYYSDLKLKLAENTETFFRIKIWKNLTSLIYPSLLTMDELKKPCIGIAQHDIEELRNGGYQEIYYRFFLTQQFVYCGFSAEAFRVHRISISTCLTTG